MIIWGSRGLERKGETGSFYCSRCDDDREYRRHKLQRFFTLYFIPLIPLEVVQEWIVCQTCKSQFSLQALKYDPRAERAQFDQELRSSFQTVLAHFGQMSSRRDRALMQHMVDAQAAFDGSSWSVDDARLEMERLDRNYDASVGILARSLSDRGRETVVMSALDAAAYDGLLDDRKREALVGLGQKLGMSDVHMRGILAS